MLIQKKICDRCGAEYDLSAESAFEGERTADFQVKVHLSGEWYDGEERKDFCPDCVKAFEEFLKGKGHAHWIPCSERLPEDLEPVNITWVNHNPESYYADIKDKPFTATGHYCNGRWWWYSVTCQDYLGEYGRCDADAMDDDIEVIAWLPLPKPWESKFCPNFGAKTDEEREEPQ